MKFYRIIATLLSPLSIQKTRLSSGSETLSYLPGSSLRGAFAAKYFQEGGGPEDDDFKRLFIEDPVCFPNLLPSDDEGKIIPQVLPLTSVSCKRFPGFRSNALHGVRDTLSKKLVERNSREGLIDWLCPICDEEMTDIAGYWNGDILAPARYEPTLFFQRHTGIDRLTGTIAPTVFYITQAMADYRRRPSEGDPEDGYCRQVLSGGVFMDEVQHAILNTLAHGPLFVGADRTRGMGELHVVIEPSDIAPPDVEGWDQSFKTKVLSLAKGDLREDMNSGVYFSVKLESHAILVDEFLRPTPELDLGLPGVKAVMKVAKPQIIRGWNSAWRMPKPDDMGVMMGSVYLFRYEAKDVEVLSRLLANLTINGVGLRREEGFGRVVACEPFHIQEEVI